MTDCDGRTKECNGVDVIFGGSKSTFNAGNGGTMRRKERETSKVPAENIIN